MLSPITAAGWRDAVRVGFSSNGATSSPDTIYGVAIANGDNRFPPLPADRHDYRYWAGGDDDDRAEADREFYEGLLFCVQGLASGRFMRWSGLGAAVRWGARRRCRTYYQAVRVVGSAFWNYREEPLA